MTVASDAITRAMPPSPVAIMTTIDHTGRWWGFTGSATLSLSEEPARVGMSVAKADCAHTAFVSSRRFMVNVLSHRQDVVAARFAQSTVDRFCAGDMIACERGLPGLEDAAARLACRTRDVRDGDDDTLVFGLVEHAHMGSGEPPLMCRDPRFVDLTARIVANR